MADGYEGNGLRARNLLRNALFGILRQLQSGNGDSDTLDYMQYRIEGLYADVLRCFDCGIVDERVVDTMREDLECFELRTDESTVMYQAGKIFTGSPGRPKYNISREQLEFLIHKRFSVDDIALLLGVGKRTVERRLEEFSLSVRATYTDMSNEELDAEVASILRNFPNTGYKRMTGFLLSRNIRVQQQRIREAMRRVNPEGTVLRALELNVVRRRKYQVKSPLALWHIDGNHKLVRYSCYFFSVLVVYF